MVQLSLLGLSAMHECYSFSKMKSSFENCLPKRRIVIQEFFEATLMHCCRHAGLPQHCCHQMDEKLYWCVLATEHLVSDEFYDESLLFIVTDGRIDGS